MHALDDILNQWREEEAQYGAVQTCGEWAQERGTIASVLALHAASACPHAVWPRNGLWCLLWQPSPLILNFWFGRGPLRA